MPAAAALPLDAARVLSERDRILAAPEFNPELDWRARLVEWFFERLDGMGGWLPFGLRAIAVLLLVATLVGVLAWLLPGRASSTRPAPARAQAVVPRGDFASLRADAVDALAAGRLAEVARLAWLAALALLDRAGVSGARASRADWEHVAAARRQRPDLVEPIAHLALEFQRSRFGHDALERAQADRCLALLAGLERDLRG
jgi:hypothetical protein